MSTHLARLKSTSVEEKWWKGVLSFDWKEIRSGNNNTQWMNLIYKDENSVSGRLVLRIIGERHSGQIMPNTDAGVTELASKAKNPNLRIEKRTKKPAIQIQKWSAPVKTDKDGITIRTDESGKQILPDDDKLSPYYKIAALVTEVFTTETRERVDRGTHLVKMAADMKKEDKTVTAAAVLEAFASKQGGRSVSDIILSSEGASALKKMFPGADMTKGAIITSSTKVVSLTQEFVSDQAIKNAGAPLPNPMTRITMNFDANNTLTKLYDKGRPFMVDGKQRYDIGKIGDTPINEDNIHAFVTPGAIIDGVVAMDGVCFSNMGISIPAKADVLVVEQYAAHETTVDDVYEDYDAPATKTPGAAAAPPSVAAVSSAAAAPPSVAAVSSAAAPPPVDTDEVDYDKILQDL